MGTTASSEYEETIHAEGDDACSPGRGRTSTAHLSTAYEWGTSPRCCPVYGREPYNLSRARVSVFFPIGFAVNVALVVGQQLGVTLLSEHPRFVSVAFFPAWVPVRRTHSDNQYRRRRRHW